MLLYVWSVMFFSLCGGSVAYETELAIDVSQYEFKVPINPKFIFRLNKSFYNSEQNGANKFVFGQNRNFL